MPRIAFVNPLTLPLDLVESTWSKGTQGIPTLAQEGIHLRLGNWRKGLELFARKYPFHILALDCMRRCHEALDESSRAAEVLSAIASAVNEDGRARDMAEKYGDLLSVAARDVLGSTAARAEFAIP